MLQNCITEYAFGLQKILSLYLGGRRALHHTHASTTTKDPLLELKYKKANRETKWNLGLKVRFITSHHKIPDIASTAQFQNILKRNTRLVNEWKHFTTNLQNNPARK